MQKLIKPLVYLLLLCAFSTAGFAQSSKSKGSNKTNSKTTTKAPVVPAPGKAVTLSIKNTAEKNIALFAGGRDGLKDPAIKELGGLSTNTLYLHVNDVVCIMDDKKKPKSCAEIKSTTQALEINSSGTVVTAK